MSKVHVFIDGSWLIKVCAPNGVLANKMKNQTDFKFDFSKLRDVILSHVSQKDPTCLELGDCHYVSSVFTLPPDFRRWAGKTVNGNQLTSDQIGKTEWNVRLRDDYASRAIAAGFQSSSIIRPDIKEWMIPKLANNRYQEKQVDTTVVALFVKYVLTNPDDYFAIVGGDADLIPAIKTVCPEFSNKVCIVSTHPDELNAAHRQTSFSYLSFDFKIDPLFLQDNVSKICEGSYIYECKNCHKVFINNSEIGKFNQPFCLHCQNTRT